MRLSVCFQCKGLHPVHIVAPKGNKYCKPCWIGISKFMQFIEDPRHLQIAVDVVRTLYKNKSVELPDLTII